MSMICELFAISPKVASRLASDPEQIDEVLESLNGSKDVVSLEKSWHGLHFVLTGTALVGEPPLDFLVAGGEPVGDVDVGYGPARMLNPDAVKELEAALAGFTEAEFDRAFDLAAMQDANVYPSIWDEPLEDLKEEYFSYFEEMKMHIHRIAMADNALLVTIR